MLSIFLGHFIILYVVWMTPYIGIWCFQKIKPWTKSFESCSWRKLSHFWNPWHPDVGSNKAWLMPFSSNTVQSISGYCRCWKSTCCGKLFSEGKTIVVLLFLWIPCLTSKLILKNVVLLRMNSHFIFFLCHTFRET